MLSTPGKTVMYLLETNAVMQVLPEMSAQW